MSIISYAQNFEDVMLWRALKHVENGFYIDVGAAWPDEDSVTKAFYERGWHGINIEPNPKLNKQLRACRPRDINLKLAVGDCEGTQTFNLVTETGLSTLDDAIARKHQAAGRISSRQEVQVTTLASIWQEHVPLGQAVHFLKVDVEGFEEAALRGNIWPKNRPWVVVVEATLPMSQEESHGAWEPVLINAGYQLAYVDGLNRFYVAQEHSELLPAFKYPPNVFDGFKLVGQHDSEVRAMQAEARAMQAKARATQAKARATQAEARATLAEVQARQAEARVNDMLSSTSWRITVPIRRVAGLAYQLKPRALKSKLKTLLKHAALYVGRRTTLKRMTLVALGRFPSLKSRLFRLVQGSEATCNVPVPNVPTNAAHLSPRAQQVYADLKIVLANSKRSD
ncbi:MAG: FkbM family methyltransferase [Hydrogenophaga sp.]|nr:FkbM family methyltransferase [Hydrogenophaga sp.]